MYSETWDFNFNDRPSGESQINFSLRKIYVKKKTMIIYEYLIFNIKFK